MEDVVFVAIPSDNITEEDVQQATYLIVMGWYATGKIGWYLESSREMSQLPEGLVQLRLKRSCLGGTDGTTDA